jgi:FtsH-binding integral membrane protein
MSVSARIKATRWLAYSFGVLAPLGDTVRRWSTWREFPPALFDDYLMGALLIAGAWATRDNRSPRGRALLAAAWGFTCALGYCSVFLHWLAMQAGELDPAPIPTQWVFAIKVLGTLLAFLALALTLVDTPAAAPDDPRR